MGGSEEEPGEHGVDRAGRGEGADDGSENPGGAGQVSTSRQGCGGASGANSAEDGGCSPGRSYPAAGAGGGRRTTARTEDRGRRPGRATPPPAHGRTTRRVRALGVPQPRAPRPLRLRPPPAARARAARLAGPAPEWGRGSTAESGDGPPSGHRAASLGLNRPQGPAEVGVGRAGPRAGGAREMRRRGRRGERGALGLLCAVGSPGLLLPIRAFWTALDPPQLRPLQ